MIVKMKKVSLVVLDETKKQSLKILRKLGLVHLETVEGQGEVLAGFRDSFTKTERALGILNDVKLSKKEAKSIKQVDVSMEEAIEKSSQVINLIERKKSLFDQIGQDAQELDRFTQWGSVNPEDFAEIAKTGVFLYMYEMPEKKYPELPESARTVVVNCSRGIVRFLLISTEELTNRPSYMPAEAYEVPLPDYSTDQIVQRIEDSKQEITKIDAEVAANVKFKKSIELCQKKLASDISFETVNSGMECDDKLAWITGYVPVDSVDNFTNACKENSWAYAVSDPEDNDETVPTKLKNNKFVSLIYPLTDFLGTVPGYKEYDISGWFLLFFCIYFGMIFGDGGYGLLVTALVALMMIKNLIFRKKNPPLLPLALLLGLSTVVWGLVSCTWFGLPADKLPSWLVNLSVKPISSAFPKGSNQLTTDQNLQILCFSLALIQLSIAHIKGIISNRRSLKFLGELGSLMQLWGMFYVVLMLVVSSKVFALNKIVYGIPIGYVCVALIAVGFVLSFIFSNYEGSVVKSILESCKNIITVLLGVVNVFSDIISYIRLWAVGLAGAAISNTVNNMAAGLLGDSAAPIVVHAIMFVLLVVLLVFGHGLNMILNLLSVIVHGVRLNTLEFSSHLGMTWSGIKYEPFSNKESDNDEQSA